jgi:hypothetical protein
MLGMALPQCEAARVSHDRKSTPRFCRLPIEAAEGGRALRGLPNQACFPCPPVSAVPFRGRGQPWLPQTRKRLKRNLQAKRSKLERKARFLPEAEAPM